MNDNDVERFLSLGDEEALRFLQELCNVRGPAGESRVARLHSFKAVEKRICNLLQKGPTDQNWSDYVI